MSKKIEARKINYECKCIPFYELEQENVRLKMQLQIINDEMKYNNYTKSCYLHGKASIHHKIEKCNSLISLRKYHFHSNLKQKDKTMKRKNMI